MQDQERRSGDRRKDGRDRLLSEAEVARMAGVSPNTVRYWRQTGTLPSVKVGKHPRVWLSAFLGLFQKPFPGGPWDLAGGTAKMDSAGDIRRPS